MRAYSTDLRTCVLAALDRGMTRGEAVTTFAISLATLKRWVARQRAGISLPPGQSSGRTRALTDADLAHFHERLQSAPDATLAEHLAWWNGQYPARSISRSTIDRAITRLNWTRKKRRSTRANRML